MRNICFLVTLTGLLSSLLQHMQPIINTYLCRMGRIENTHMLVLCLPTCLLCKTTLTNLTESLDNGTSCDDAAVRMGLQLSHCNNLINSS